MPEGRPTIPAQIKRDVLVEAGHRCAIPTCKSIPVEIAHIDPWTEVREHRFENLIALCPTCHTRFDQGGIDRQSMLQYKANLGVIVNRYSDLERRVLEHFVANPEVHAIALPGGLDLLLRYLKGDGLIMPVYEGGGVWINNSPAEMYALTPIGSETVDKMKNARPLT